MGKEDFLNLLMTQMSHQDPLNPMETENMMQQMSSLSTVEQLQSLNGQVEELAKLTRQSVWAGASSLLGRDVEVGTRNLNLQHGMVQPVSYKLEGDADKVALVILDQRGEMVRRVELESRAQGVHEFVWDGKDNEGDMLPDGQYNFNLAATTEGGERINVKLSKSGQVAMVRLDEQNPMVQINGEWLSANQILGVSNKSKDRFESVGPMPLRQHLMPRPMLNSDRSSSED